MVRSISSPVRHSPAEFSLARLPAPGFILPSFMLPGLLLLAYILQSFIPVGFPADEFYPVDFSTNISYYLDRAFCLIEHSILVRSRSSPPRLPPTARYMIPHTRLPSSNNLGYRLKNLKVCSSVSKKEFATCIRISKTLFSCQYTN